MNIIEIKLHKFLSHKNTELNLGKDGLYLILGKNKLTGLSNASGKTSLIVDSIEYCLFGNSNRCITAGDNLITDFSDKMSVEITFIKNNRRSTVLRKRTKGKATKLTINGKCGNSIKETQAVLEKIIGMDYDTFRHSVGFEQGKMSSFSELSPTEAKSVLMRILQLDKYDGYYKRAKNLFAEVALRKEKTELELSLLENTTVSPHTENRKDTESRVGAVQRHLSKIEKEYKRYLKIESRREEIKKQLNELKNKEYHYKIKIDQLKKKIEKFVQLNSCPFCLQKIFNVHKISIKKASLIEIKKLQKQAKIIDTQIKEKVKELPKSISDKVERLRKQDNDLREELGSLKVKLVSIEETAKELAIMKKKRAILTQNKKLIFNKMKDYSLLMNAFGKNGIQAYIIDNIIPEIQNIANDIIGRIADLQLNMQTQKQLKSGKESETLDIIISDSSGDKSYYNYSGGEKTLIDFALRIALSVILSRRSGTQIETLILDEPFGSLDARNKAKIMDAINFVRRRFQFKKIFLITHDYELQDSCENIIEVLKDRAGSSIKREELKDE